MQVVALCKEIGCGQPVSPGSTVSIVSLSEKYIERIASVRFARNFSSAANLIDDFDSKTILLNVVIWDQHATTGGILALFVCLAGGSIYEQAPMRGESKKSPDAVIDDDDLATDDLEDNSEKIDLIEKDAAAKRRG